MDGGAGNEGQTELPEASFLALLAVLPGSRPLSRKPGREAVSGTPSSC